MDHGETVPGSGRQPDTQYRDVLARIMADGVWAPTRQGPRARTLMQQTMSFDLGNGYPLIPDRDVRRFWSKAVGELCAFINGVTDVERMATEFGCDWWGPWATTAKTEKRGLEPGTMGPGSYGGAFKSFPTLEGEEFDQFANLVEQLKQLPDLRTHFVSPWIPQYNSRVTGRVPKTTIAPCHGWVHVRVLDGALHLHMFQRSGDVPVGVPSNMAQYSALTLMLSHLTGIPAGRYYHTISDAHIYEDQVDGVNELLTRPALPFGDLQLTEAGREITDIHDFRREHVELVNYEPHAAVWFPPAAV